MGGSRAGLIRPRQPPIGSAEVGLRLLCSELNREVLAVLAEAAMTEVALGHRLVVSSRSTLRKHLDELLGAKAVERCGANDGRRGGEYGLTPGGHGLLAVLESANRWLESHPQPAIDPAGPLAWRAFAAFAESWQVALVESLAQGSRSEAELDELIDVRRGKVGRELRRLHGAGVVEPVSGRGGSESRYGLTAWGRRGIGVLAVAARWEAAYVPDLATPVAVRDAVVALLIALRLVRLPGDATGVCALTAEVEPGAELSPRSGGVWARFKAGRLTACGEGAAPEPPDAWLRGTFSAWFEAVLDDRPAALQHGGDRSLSRPLVRALHSELYGK